MTYRICLSEYFNSSFLLVSHQNRQSKATFTFGCFMNLALTLLCCLSTLNRNFLRLCFVWIWPQRKNKLDEKIRSEIRWNTTVQTKVLLAYCILMKYQVKIKNTLMKEADIKKKKKKNHHKYATLPKSHSALAQSRKSKGCFSVRSQTYEGSALRVKIPRMCSGKSKCESTPDQCFSTLSSLRLMSKHCTHTHSHPNAH